MGWSMERIGAASSAQSLKRPAVGSCRKRAGLLAASELSSPIGLGQAPDLAVTQPVVDEGEKFAAGRHLGDIAAAALSDPPVGGLEVTAGVVLGRRFHGRPPQQL